MAQCFKLVNSGIVDRVIVFDSLPDHLLAGVRTREVAGFPRAWARWLGEIGSTREVLKTETSVDLARNWTFTHTPVGQEPCFFILEYMDINADKERWREIGEYLRTHVRPDVHLKDKIQDMALPLAKDSNSELSAEPEDIMEKALISVKVAMPAEPQAGDLVKPGEQILVKRGRPKKVLTEAA